MNKGVRWIDVLFLAGVGALLGCQARAGSISKVELGLTGSSFGMVADNATGSATVFNANNKKILGTVPVMSTPTMATGDCSITVQGTKGFFTRFDSTVVVVDLTTTPPTLAGAPNPIPISNFGEDTALSPDGKFLVVCDGSAPAPVSVIDVATQTEHMPATLFPPDCNSVDVCSDNSVLITSFFDATVRRLMLSESGDLTDTNEVLHLPEVPGGSEFPNNVSCSPMAKTGIVMGNFGSAISFTIPGLTQVDRRNLGSYVVSGAINHKGNRAYFRTTNGISMVKSFDFDQSTGIFGAAPLFQVSVAPALTFFGMDQLAIHPLNGSIYVSEPGGVRILNAMTGTTIGSITSPSLSQATGVCFGAGPPDESDDGD